MSKSKCLSHAVATSDHSDFSVGGGYYVQYFGLAIDKTEKRDQMLRCHLVRQRNVRQCDLVAFFAIFPWMHSYVRAATWVKPARDQADDPP